MSLQDIAVALGHKAPFSNLSAYRCIKSLFPPSAFLPSPQPFFSCFGKWRRPSLRINPIQLASPVSSSRPTQVATDFCLSSARNPLEMKKKFLALSKTTNTRACHVNHVVWSRAVWRSGNEGGGLKVLRKSLPLTYSSPSFTPTTALSSHLIPLPTLPPLPPPSPSQAQLKVKKPKNAHARLSRIPAGPPDDSTCFSQSAHGHLASPTSRDSVAN